MMMLDLGHRLWYHVTWHPLIILLIDLGTASEIPILSLILSIACDQWNSLEYSITCDVLRRSAADMPL